MTQLRIVLDEVFEARNDLEIERREVNFSLAVGDLLWCQLNFLVLKQYVVCEGQT